MTTAITPPRFNKPLALTALLLAATGAAQAALFDRGGGLVYDSTRNITWLADMNHAKTSGYDTDGRMSWAAASTWADTLVYGGHDDWRLPGALNSDGSGPCLGANCTGSQLGGLFITELGNKAGETVLNQTGDTAEQIANLALFSNVDEVIYWSGTTYTPDAADAWAFRADSGSQTHFFKTFELYAVAVRPGDVAAVPEPQSLALTVLALGLAAGASRRQARR
jgi:hypothetical protein